MTGQGCTAANATIRTIRWAGGIYVQGTPCDGAGPGDTSASRMDGKVCVQVGQERFWGTPIKRVGRA